VVIQINVSRNGEAVFQLNVSNNKEMVFQIKVGKSSEAVFPIKVSNNNEPVFQNNVSKNSEVVIQCESLAIAKRSGQRKKRFLRNRRKQCTIDPIRPKGLQGEKVTYLQKFYQSEALR
jgi:hypothetical protein